MLSCVSSKTRWSKQQDGLIKERLATPLPRVQMAILLLLHLAEPMCATVIHPFIAQLILELGVTGGDPSTVGYYVGLIESLFFITEAACVMHWGRLSDSIGRKPVIITGLLGLTLSMFSFGISKSFVGLVVSRALAGALNANTGVLKTIIAEITDETNVAGAYSCLPIVWFVGVTFAPMVGGQFSRPAERMPLLFDTPFWQDHPYALPCFAAAGFSFTCMIIAFFYLEETLPVKRRLRLRTRTDSNATLYDLYDSERIRLLPSEEDLSSPEDSSISSILTHRVLLAIVNFGFLAFLEIAFCALLPIFLASSSAVGGLGLSPPSIGSVLGGLGLINGCIQILLFVPAHELLGTRLLYTLGVAVFAGIYGLMPFISRWVKESSGSIGWQSWALLAVIGLLCPIENMAFNCIFLYVNASAKSSSTLGATNGIAQTAASLARAVGPAGATSLFAFSNQHPDIANGAFVYWVLIGITAVAVVSARLLPEKPWERGPEWQKSSNVKGV